MDTALTTRSVRAMTEADWPDVSGIYGEGIATGDATFETDVPEWSDWDASHLESCRLVAEVGGEVVGWVALSPVSQRSVYRGVAEHSIYVAADARGRGIGGELLDALIETSENAGFWTLRTGIFPENVASIALHEMHGFRVVGTHQRLGSHHGRWRDVVLMERRSETVGT